MKSKIFKYSFVFFLSLIAVFGGIHFNKNFKFWNINKPELLDEGPQGKNARWDENTAQAYYKELARISQQQKNKKTAADSYSESGLNGYWENKGPHNMPGAFQFCEMDEGTDTIYAVTCGHYGGVQFIWKGTLKGDNWKTINPKNPARFEDLIVIPNSGKRRVIAGKQGGNIMFSDNAGATWITPNTLPSVLHSTIVNRQDNNIIYTVSNNKVFKSIDNGTTFSEFQSFTSSANKSRLYSPRWAIQPGASEVYLARDDKFYKLNAGKTAFTQISTIPINGDIAISGDNRKLWIVLNGRKWYSSSNGGVTFTYTSTTNYWYSDPEPDMSAGQFIGVNPENPDILIGGYSIPLITKNAGVSTNADSKSFWGYYQNSVGNDAKVRVNYHPDFQSSQFFYDKDGKLISLRSSDGGMFISYNEWIKNSFPTYADIQDVYYNISLFGQPTQEAYRGGFIYGYLHPDHLTSGTQDQGWQDTRASSFGTGTLYWDQVAGGDGPSCITGDGKIGWSYNYQGDKEFRRIQLYNGTTYKGQTGTKTSPVDFTFTGGSYFTPSVGDWQNGDRIWVLSQSLRRIEYNGSTIVGKEDLLGTGNSYVQGIAQSRVNADIVYAMRNGVVYKSSNRGTSWTQVTPASATGITGFYENRGMGWSSPLDANIVLFATQSGTAVKSVFSTDGGLTWENVTGSGANLFPAAQVNGMAGSKNGKYVFASTNMGPYVFSVDLKKWYPLATEENVPLFWGQIVYCVDYGDKEVVHFSTWGQGIWDFVIQDNVVQNDVSITNLTVPSSLSCSGSLTPSITIKNLGNTTLSSVRIKVYENNVLKETKNQVTTLVKNSTQNINLGSLSPSANSTIKVVLELPNGVADEVNTNNELSSIVMVGNLIPQNGISIIGFSSQETSGEGANNGKAIHLLDGDINTFWHAQWTGSGSTMPHYLSFNLGSTYDISKISWLHRQGNSNGQAKTANIYISEDGVLWGTPELVNISTSTNVQNIPLTTKKGKFIKVEILSNHSGTSVASIGELNFYGCENISTYVKIAPSPLVKIYPNPASEFISIQGEKLTMVEILNLSGQTVKSVQANGDLLEINISALSKGNYLVKIFQENKTSIQKLVVR